MDKSSIIEGTKSIISRCNHKVVGLALGGSIAYGLNTPFSDIDYRGIAVPHKCDVLQLKDFEQEVFNNDADGVVYSLNKFVALLLACNPNVIELLNVQQEHIVLDSYVYFKLRQNRSWFISKNAANTFGGYATQQLRRIENSMNRENESKVAENARRSLEASLQHKDSQYPSLALSNLVLSKIGEDDIRLSGSLNAVKFSELKAFSDMCQSTILNASNLAARNKKRDSSKLAKHASHLIRLLRMGSEMLETGEINTYRAEDRQLLLDIKNGMWLNESNDGIRTYDDAFWDLLNQEETRFKYARSNTSLPNKPDYESAKSFISDIHEGVVNDMFD